jgi:hypothetical protein
MPPRFHLPGRWLSVVQKLKYYFGSSLAVAGALIALWGFLVFVGKPGTWFQPDKLLALSRLIAGTFAVGVGSRVLLSVPRPRRKDSGTNLFNSKIISNLRRIYTGGGNYNESISTYIQGDNFEIKVDYTSMSSDLSEATVQLQEVVTRLVENRECNLEDALQRVVNDLATKAKNNRAVRVKLLRWRESIGDTASDTSIFEAARAVVQATTVSDILPASLSSTGATNYQRLEYLLKAGNWREADKVTAEIILKPLLQEVAEALICLYIDDYIKSFPGEDLRYINNLWLEHSKGHFGFSVQRDIWREVDGDYEAFGDRVGWRDDGDWILYSDITYTRKAPSGHLPIMIMMVEDFSFSNSCKYAESILETFVSRRYRVY